MLQLSILSSGQWHRGSTSAERQAERHGRSGSRSQTSRKSWAWLHRAHSSPASTQRTRLRLRALRLISLTHSPVLALASPPGPVTHLHLQLHSLLTRFSLAFTQSLITDRSHGSGNSPATRNSSSACRNAHQDRRYVTAVGSALPTDSPDALESILLVPRRSARRSALSFPKNL